jgi:ABC-2 type transport system permease protein
MPPDLRIVLLVARREFLTRIRSRFWLVGTGLLVLVVCGYIVLQAKVISPQSSHVKVAFIEQAASLQSDAIRNAAALGVTIDPQQVRSAPDGIARVTSGGLDALVSGTPTKPAVTVKEQLSPALTSAITAAAREFALNETLLSQQVDPSSVNSVLAQAGPVVTPIDPGAAQRSEREVAGIVVAVLLYVALLMYGQIVAGGVVEEKANRIVEILLSTIRARQLLFGKVLGVGLVGLCQLVVVGGASLLVAGRLQLINIPTVGVSSVVGGLIWFVLGFVLYAMLYAAAGSLVSRQEDLAAVTSPLTVLVLGSYLAFFWVIANPTSPAAVILSVLPPFAPIMMPARMATGDATAWQLAVAAVLTLGMIAALNVLAARIYANSVLRLGSRVSLRQAWSGAP